ncbi:MAG: mismatch repair protein MutT [Pseudomonadota bacterium]|jgi:8-oxo-dGTP diphosphatase
MTVPVIRVVAAMIEDRGRYLITQRRPSAVLPSLWEFPGGRVEDGETDEAALAREVLHRLGVSVDVGQLVSFVRHPYERYTIELHLYECKLASGQPSKRNVFDFAWVQSDEFEHYPFTPADELSVAKLLGLS